MSLPTWEVATLNNKIGITCPYKDCRGKALVSRTWPRRKVRTTDSGKLTIIGRPCTYCSRTAKIP